MSNIGKQLFLPTRDFIDFRIRTVACQMILICEVVFVLVYKQTCKLLTNVLVIRTFDILLFACWVIFHAFFCRLLRGFFKIYFFRKFFQEHYQSDIQFVSRSGPTVCIWFHNVLQWRIQWGFRGFA